MHGGTETSKHSQRFEEDRVFIDPATFVKTVANGLYKERYAGRLSGDVSSSLQVDLPNTAFGITTTSLVSPLPQGY